MIHNFMRYIIIDTVPCWLLKSRRMRQSTAWPLLIWWYIEPGHQCRHGYDLLFLEHLDFSWENPFIKHVYICWQIYISKFIRQGTYECATLVSTWYHHAILNDCFWWMENTTLTEGSTGIPCWDVWPHFNIQCSAVITQSIILQIFTNDTP